MRRGMPSSQRPDLDAGMRLLSPEGNGGTDEISGMDPGATADHPAQADAPPLLRHSPNRRTLKMLRFRRSRNGMERAAQQAGMQSNRTNSFLSGNILRAKAWRLRMTWIALAFFLVGRCALAQATGSIQGKVTDTEGAFETGPLPALRAGNVDVPLRSNQARGAATPVQYEVLPGPRKVEVKLFVAENVGFPGKQ